MQQAPTLPQVTVANGIWLNGLLVKSLQVLSNLFAKAWQSAIEPVVISGWQTSLEVELPRRQVQPGSTVHLDEQPSPFLVFPSSHW